MRYSYDKPVVAFSKGGIYDAIDDKVYEFTMDTVLDLLNKQDETIGGLKSANGEMEDYLGRLEERYNEQSVEYEGLEEQVERLLDFKDNVFNIITKKIKNGEQAIEWGESIGANVGAMGFHIEMLKMLLKELQD